LCLGLFCQLSLPMWTSAQTSAEPGQFRLKLSGFENLVVGGASQGRGGESGGSSESEIEFTPQYKTKSGTTFAIRGVLNLQAASNVTGVNSDWQLTAPELSLFAIGKYGRIEVGDRSGFPQSLIGFTPSEISFATAEFGPESGERLDPSGGLPTVYLPHPLANRINNLAYLGYAERFYDDRSLKLIYVTPRSRTGFYGAASYTPSTDISTGFNANENTRTPSQTGLLDVQDPGIFRNITQAALVWTHRTQNVDLSIGSTYSYAAASAVSNPLFRDSNSLSEGITATVHDAWTFGLSSTYDGFSGQREVSTIHPAPVSPYGIVASANYVEGPWTYGGYYQHATANSVTPQSSRDTLNVGEVGVARLIDQNHDLFGAGYYTDLKLFASLYYYGLHGVQPFNMNANESGPVLLFGARFSFF
jgi:hypothetical protein